MTAPKGVEKYLVQVAIAILIMFIAYSGGALTERMYTTSEFEGRLDALERAQATNDAHYEEIIRRLDDLAVAVRTGE
ncbi:MAG: hypothetical protein ACYS7Y_29985 [Planctomycetota bacterium]|jgi:hypothetical protein